METFESEVRDGMRIDWDVPIEMDDGLEFSRVFRERVRVVDAGEYVHEDGDGDE